MKQYFVKRLPKPVPEYYNNPHADYWEGKDDTALFLIERKVVMGSPRDKFVPIGQISELATWVKEDDEFDEDEVIETWTKYHTLFIAPHIKTTQWELLEYYKKEHTFRVKIKCPHCHHWS